MQSLCKDRHKVNFDLFYMQHGGRFFIYIFFFCLTKKEIHNRIKDAAKKQRRIKYSPRDKTMKNTSTKLFSSTFPSFFPFQFFCGLSVRWV